MTYIWWRKFEWWWKTNSPVTTKGSKCLLLCSHFYVHYQCYFKCKRQGQNCSFARSHTHLKISPDWRGKRIREPRQKLGEREKKCRLGQPEGEEGSNCPTKVWSVSRTKGRRYMPIRLRTRHKTGTETRQQDDGMTTVNMHQINSNI